MTDLSAIVERASASYRSGWLVTRANINATVSRLATLGEARSEATRLSSLAWRLNEDILVIDPRKQTIVATYRAGKEIEA